ncbi:hypothetical protein D3C81_1255780 [compost metagenome]
MVAEKQQQVGDGHHHKGHRHAAQQQAVAVQTAMAAGNRQHQQHAAQGADKGCQRQGQHAEYFTDMQHHQHRTERGTGGHAEQVRVGQGVARRRLQHRTDHCQATTDQCCQEHARYADKPDDMFLAGGPGRGFGGNAEDLEQQHPPYHLDRHRRGAKTQRHHAGHQQQANQSEQQQAIAAHVSCRPAAMASMASTFSRLGVAPT